MRQSPELLASYFTLAGDIQPFRPPTVSPLPLRHRAEAASRAGFRGFGLHGDELKMLRRNLAWCDIAVILDDNGLVHREVELLRGWFATDGEPHTAAERRFLLDAAGSLGARHVKIGTSGPVCPLEQMTEHFAVLCDEAAEAGTAVVLEISPIGQIPDLGTGLAIVDGAQRPNGKLLLDVWHLTRTGAAMAEIAALPPSVIGHVELCDGPLIQEGDYVDETVNRRRPCGEGAFELGTFVSAIAATGYGGLYGVEILSAEDRVKPVADVARTAFDSAMACLCGVSPEHPSLVAAGD
jgi:sugar phosphate isomerase/epimerase